MKKSVFSFAILSFLVFPVFVLADPPPCPDSAICNPLPYESIPDVINKIIDVAAVLAGPIAVALLVYAAYLFVLGGTNQDNVKKARAIILYVVVGIAVLVMSKAIVYVTISVLSK